MVVEVKVEVMVTIKLRVRVRVRVIISLDTAIAAIYFSTKTAASLAAILTI